MNTIKRLLFSTTWTLCSLIVEIIALIFTMLPILLALLLMQPLMRLIISGRFMEDKGTYPWVDDVGNFFMELIPVIFIISTLLLVLYVGYKYWVNYNQVESKLWNKIPNRIKGNDILFPKWVDSPKFLIPVAVFFLLCQCAVVSWACYQRWSWEWYLGGLLCFVVYVSTAGIAIYFSLRSRKRRLLEKK